ncbi:MAG: NAD(P)/FAD-dependent oxidoreductase [Bacteroidia bacterium]|nr:NAD(P)/FAD-dependent oxidoreductase [Bacteroidia bacterium]
MNSSPRALSGLPVVETIGDPDVIVIGAGIAGLTSAALLATTGRKVLVLEGIHYPGGCASSYEKDGAVFDVGATTFSGIAPGQPLRALFDIIGEFDALLPADPPMGVSMNARTLHRSPDRFSWYEQVRDHFGQDQRAFWDELRHFSDAAYGMLTAVRHLPPLTPLEALADLRSLQPAVLRHLPHVLSPIASRIQRHGLSDPEFRRFIDAQLLITSQASSSHIPFLAGALGLTYPDYPVFSVAGGMIAYARFLEERLHSAGGYVEYLQRVVAVTRESGGWSVRTARGTVYTSPVVVSSVPIFNLPAIFDGEAANYFRRIVRRIESSGVTLWGAFTVYALVESELVKEVPINLQVILPHALEYCGSSTLFCSFSHPADARRAPDGYRALTISTHIRRDHPALLQRGEQRKAWKAYAAAEVEVALRSHVPELREFRFSRIQCGTPTTFEKYTGRLDGLVGGLPLDRRLFPFRFPSPKTPFEGVYLCGDTIFPGQGLPGVTLGALALYNRFRMMDE